MGGRYWRKAGAAASAGALATAWASPAVADTFDDAGGDVGFYLSAVFGDGDVRLGWGLQARAFLSEQYSFSCGDDPAPFVGATTRLGFVGWSQPRLSVAAIGGAFVGNVLSGSGEVGLGYRWGANGGLQTVLGLELGALIGNLRAVVDPGHGELALDLGLRAGTRLTQACVIEGRPLREVDGLADGPVVFANGETRNEATALWCERARTEWASVPAFIELSEQLEVLGAPATLIDRANAAAAEEIRHAVLAGGVASTLGAGVVAIDRTKHTPRAPLVGRDGLVRVAVESWTDGCLGEGLAASIAALESKLVEAPDELRSVRARIADDEARHASLAWDVIRWALDEDPEAVRPALVAARDASGPAHEITANDDRLRRVAALDEPTVERTRIAHEQHARRHLDRALG